MDGISLFSALLAGAVSFLSPCLLPLLPAFLGMLAGLSEEERKAVDQRAYTRRVFLSGVCYVLGFLIIFTTLGLAVGSITSFLTSNRVLLQRIGGVFVLLFSLQFLGAYNFRFLSREYKIHLPDFLRGKHYLGAFLMGLVFGVGWTPCFGPILGGILLLAGTYGSALKGGLLLFTYGLGIGIPFLIVCLLWAKVTLVVGRLHGLMKWVRHTGGVFLFLVGILLITNTFDKLNGWILESFQEFFNQIANFT